MGAARALLGDLEGIVHVDRVIGTRGGAVGAPRAGFRVDDHQAIVPLVNRAFDLAGVKADRFVAVVAEHRDIVDFDLGDGAPYVLTEFQPELPGLRLGLGIGGPIVAAVLVLAGNLAAVAPVADGRVENEDLHLASPSLSTQASNFSP